MQNFSAMIRFLSMSLLIHPASLPFDKMLTNPFPLNDQLIKLHKEINYILISKSPINVSFSGLCSPTFPELFTVLNSDGLNELHSWGTTHQ